MDGYAQARSVGPAVPQEAEVSIADDLHELVSVGATVLEGLGQLEVAATDQLHAGLRSSAMSAPMRAWRRIQADIGAL